MGRSPGPAGGLRGDRSAAGLASRALVGAGGGPGRARGRSLDRGTGRAPRGPARVARGDGLDRRHAPGRALVRGPRRLGGAPVPDRRHPRRCRPERDLPPGQLALPRGLAAVHARRVPPDPRPDAPAPAGGLPRLAGLDAGRDRDRRAVPLHLLHGLHRRFGRDDPRAGRAAPAGSARERLRRGLLAGPADGVRIPRTALPPRTAVDPLRHRGRGSDRGPVPGRPPARPPPPGSPDPLRLPREPPEGADRAAPLRRAQRLARPVASPAGARPARHRPGGDLRRLRDDRRGRGPDRRLRAPGPARVPPRGRPADARRATDDARVRLRPGRSADPADGRDGPDQLDGRRGGALRPAPSGSAPTSTRAWASSCA